MHGLSAWHKSSTSAKLVNGRAYLNAQRIRGNAAHLRPTHPRGKSWLTVAIPVENATATVS